MRFRNAIVILTLSALQLACAKNNKEKVASSEENKTVATSFWAHRYSMEKDVMYGDDAEHRLDIYTHVKKTGEPNWFDRFKQ